MIGIKNKRWLLQRFPFKHIVVRDVFEDAVVERLGAAFRVRLADQAAAGSVVANYDARIMALAEQDRSAFAPLLDVEWLALVSQAMGLKTTFEVDAALHSHPPGSRSGWIHNDFNPGWFARAASEGEVVFSSKSGCNYKTGQGQVGDTKPVQRMRYLTLIYYLNNPAWFPGMGGETGIFSARAQSIEMADSFIPPINNSLFLFECTPHSWHSFRTTSFSRNSITLWLHRDFAEARKQWPGHEPVYWT